MNLDFKKRIKTRGTKLLPTSFLTWAKNSGESGILRLLRAGLGRKEVGVEGIKARIARSVKRQTSVALTQVMGSKKPNHVSVDRGVMR